MKFEGRVTRNHEVIKQWIKDRNGWPALKKRVRGTQEEKTLHIAFPEEENEEKLERVSWEKFFKHFEAQELAFLYQERRSGGKSDRFLFL